MRLLRDRRDAPDCGYEMQANNESQLQKVQQLELVPLSL